jgi:1-acyl-sn-glycerol-3-phosphate acyltransferase
VNRKNRVAAVRSLEEAMRAVQRGWRVAIFAEGTRFSDGFIHPFKKGAFATAIEGQLPIVPLALDGSHRVMAKGSLQIRPGTIRMAFGKAISPTAQDDRMALLQRVRAEIAALHKSIGGAGEAPNEPPVAVARVA